eukprot:CAMPEP_0197861022 /NCGR_PEP_ID=MMETSP1438-20131217/36802_1 /TAXON_ID=1461541 /ORGANISM="Pterosperma sp., Strain CCMP1384" /LENGTH=105 /DNA_ID=CAMNT_0043478077 /DNA_START=102 /DNA_END=416 /DNA_ORIENTATION=-
MWCPSCERLWPLSSAEPPAELPLHCETAPAARTDGPIPIHSSPVYSSKPSAKLKVAPVADPGMYQGSDTAVHSDAGGSGPGGGSYSSAPGSIPAGAIPGSENWKW